MTVLQDYLPLLLTGTGATIKLALTALAFGLFFGLLLAIGESSRNYLIRYPVIVFTSIFRSVPELLVIFFIFYGGSYLINQLFPYYVNVSAFIAGVIALAVIFSAYAAQVYRSAFMAIPNGQIVAAKAFGITGIHLYRRIVLPQLWRHALPGLSNLWLVLLKDTALVSLLGLSDLMTNAKIAVGATKEPFVFYTAVAVIYLLLTSVSQLVINHIKKRTSVHVGAANV